MSQILNDLEVGLDEDLKEVLARRVPAYKSHRILRQSVDARRSNQMPLWIYSVEVFGDGETPSTPDYDPVKIEWPASRAKPLVIGTGPAGLFAAVRLVERGIPCIVLERGSVGEKRILKINQFWRYGQLDPDNNVCIGEGGAGLYSDGKLITRIKSPHIPYVMDRLVRFGAPEEIRWLANPHVGSDKIRRVIPKLRKFLLQMGCEIHFDTPMKELIVENEKSATPVVDVKTGVRRTTRVVGVRTTDGREFRSDHVILATGHSAEDILHRLHDQGVFMEGKSFALGLRIEHPQSAINKIQYRAAWDHPALGSANYRLADHDDKTGVGVYSFCMCPGGYVLSSGTEDGAVVANGMSNYNRNSPFANSAIVISIDHEKRFGKGTSKENLFGGLEFRRSLETKAFSAVQGEALKGKSSPHAIPAQRAVDFLKGRLGPTVATSSPSGVAAVRLDQILPADLVERMRVSLEAFNSKMRGFISEEAQFHGVESRTSCPIRMTRATGDLESLSHAGLYPAGEGAGYAGGITSAACDGVKIADHIASLYS
ncbi:NAD(P)/FAD-dependent oxidoreductase [soil metagenome]